MGSFVWSDKNLACIASYNILEGDQQLNQFDSSFLRFESAPKVKLSSLPYFPKFGASATDIEGRSAQIARQFLKFVITLYTNRKERPETTVFDTLKAFSSLFASDTATIGDLAQTTDEFFKFRGEL